MKITIIQVDKTKTAFIKEAEAEYLKRLQPSATINVITVPQSKLSAQPSPSERALIRQNEAKSILSKIPQASTVIALDERGKQFTSPEFADLLRNNRDFAGANLTFIIGGSYGLDESVLQKAKIQLSFSKFTFTHEMIRALLLEQIYRAFTILANKTYHY
jgi:23S rRNA (pseudouridine1915-N3)-methyltransferase